METEDLNLKYSVVQRVAVQDQDPQWLRAHSAILWSHQICQAASETFVTWWWMKGCLQGLAGDSMWKSSDSLCSGHQGHGFSRATLAIKVRAHLKTCALRHPCSHSSNGISPRTSWKKFFLSCLVTVCHQCRSDTPVTLQWHAGFHQGYLLASGKGTAGPASAQMSFCRHWRKLKKVSINTEGWEQFFLERYFKWN